MKSFADRLLELAINVLVVAILLTIAWQMLRPLLPVVVIGGAVVLAGRRLIAHGRDW
jgi:hypothetical protein